MGRAAGPGGGTVVGIGMKVVSRRARHPAWWGEGGDGGGGDRRMAAGSGGIAP